MARQWWMNVFEGWESWLILIKVCWMSWLSNEVANFMDKIIFIRLLGCRVEFEPRWRWWGWWKKSMNEIERKEQKYLLCERVKREEDPDEECWGEQDRTRILLVDSCWFKLCFGFRTSSVQVREHLIFPKYSLLHSRLFSSYFLNHEVSVAIQVVQLVTSIILIHFYLSMLHLSLTEDADDHQLLTR